ncbi:hypothetical protein LCGC14_2571790 [marine sediment metagenome]|uniref:Uncharacterized protein n=1 Tax=marine sediment metagenome TaxID=412755 RepID=A0A0F9AHH5_9ZZZZ
MSPDKVKTIRGHKIEQFYWAGRDVVYIDNRLTDWKYDEITPETIALASAKGRKMKKIETPVLEKIRKVHEDSQRISEFLEWLQTEEITLAEWTGSDCDECGDENLMPISMNREHLLAKYFCIDLVKAEKERQAILDDIRAKKASAEKQA